MAIVKKAFRPKARIMELLGEQLIKNHTLALFELIKNSYDADASYVKLTLNNINTDGASIEVVDDGVGMDLDTVVNIWMEPAHGHKSLFRESGKRTNKGRLPVGEKGVGRFAVHRLGKKISMSTRAYDQDVVTVEIDWDKFSKSEYLDEAFIAIETRPSKASKPDKTGTKIVITELKQDWKRGDIRRLYRAVSSMTSANLLARENNSDNFVVEFNLNPESKWLDDLFDPDLVFSQALFEFDFKLDDNGLTYKYKYQPYPALVSDYKGVIEPRCVDVKLESPDFFKFVPSNNERSKKRKARSERFSLVKNGIGPITGKILGFDLDRVLYDRYLKDESGGLSEYLKAQGGLKVYRDNLRVYNYGEQGDDWLGLDHRRIQSPTKRMGNQQLLGEIHLDLDKSSALKEKTNREGFVENEAYGEFVHAMLSVMAQFEAERNKDKRILKSAIETKPGGDFRGSEKQKSTEELLDELKQEVIAEKNISPKVGNLVNQVIKSFKETRDAMLSSAGAGLGLTTVFHELERGIRNLHMAIRDGVDSKRLEIISEELVSLLQGAMYMVSKKEKEVISASKLINQCVNTQQRRFKRHNIKFLPGFENSTLHDFDITGVRRMFTSAIVNIIDNAIYWMDGEKDDDRYLWIGLSSEFEGPAIIIADNGPGFIDGGDELIQPFFTRKPAGMGIGLYYADMVMKAHSGRLVFPNANSIDVPVVTKGACIALVFDKDK
ncbi:sensor histidine kinase [Klebsiella michiganensis]|uniref:sensor histidine kinase n=1 Tax=Klebsiella michiganensis TaxID=1134687 RepID=UPI001CCC0F63|nr:sensor histidine kinase [Klebsiella michiganensis]MBZ7626070.1 sensor histidine kinase [Klebsiella michiganensis]MCW9448153.1 sensor histidine kinase [Klebsiella michiganensis]